MFHVTEWKTYTEKNAVLVRGWGACEEQDIHVSLLPLFINGVRYMGIENPVRTSVK